MGQSFITVSGGPPTLTLPLGTEVPAIARESGAATLAFLRGSSGWGKRELAGWLEGRYRRVISHTRAPADPTCLEPAPPSSRADFSTLPAILGEARRRTLAVIVSALDPGSKLDFAVAAIQAGHLVRVSDVQGAEGWAPIDRPRTRLADRLASLVAVQRLACPEEFLEAWAALDRLFEEVEVDERWNASA